MQSFSLPWRDIGVAARKPKEVTNNLNRDQVFLADSDPSHNAVKTGIWMRTYIGAVIKKAIKIMSLSHEVPQHTRNFNKAIASPWDKICDTFFCEKGL